MKRAYRGARMQKRDPNKATSQLHSNHTHAQIRPRKFAAHLQNTSMGLLLHVKRILKDLNYKKVLFTVVKRNLLTLEMNK